MTLLDPTWIRDKVDYSFGDESGCGIPGGYMKVANSSNEEFMRMHWQCVNEKRPYMTLFIDNIRLYRRACIRYTAVEQTNPQWKILKDQKVQRLANEDLLQLLASLPDMQFIIFTGFEDTPIDEGIWEKIPDNVIGIWGSNAIVYGGKVHPIPYGLQRKLCSIDNRLIMLHVSIYKYKEPTKMMYINYNPDNHPSRTILNNHYKKQPWVTIHQPGPHALIVYQEYLNNIKDHRFMLCPSGNAEGCDCHRDIECLYMRRVPIVQDTPYHREIFGLLKAPVLYVDSLCNVTEQLLKDNMYLYDQMQEYNLDNLDIELMYNSIINSI